MASHFNSPEEPWLDELEPHAEDVSFQAKLILKVSEYMMGLFSNAKVIDLRRNFISQLPESFGSLVHLEELMLTSNRLTSLPNSIGSLHKLRELHVNRNELRSLPLSLCNLSSLEVLTVADNAIDELPCELGKLSNLKSLFIHNNYFTMLPTSFAQLSKLKVFSLEWLLYAAPSLPVTIRDEGKGVIDKLQRLCCTRLPAREIACLDVLDSISDHVLDVSKVDPKDRSRLHVSCAKSHVGVVKSLVRHASVQLNAIDADGYSPLLLAVREGFTVVCSVLLEAQADVNCGGGPYGSSMHVAIVGFCAKIVDLLLQRQSNVNFVDIEGNTPLHVLLSVFDKGGAKSEYIGMCLMKARSDCNVRNADRWAPIHLAARRGQQKGIEFICRNALQPGQNSSTRFDLDLVGGSHRWTALHLAGHACHGAVVHHLLHAKANTESLNKDGKTARYVSRGNLTVCKILKKFEMETIWHRLHRNPAKSSTHVYSHGGSLENTPLHAIRDLMAGEDAKILSEFARLVTAGARSAQFLLSFPALREKLGDTRLQDARGYCAIMYACAHGDEQLIRLLLSATSDDQLAQLGQLSTSEERWTLLHLLCRSTVRKGVDYRSSLVSFLLSVGSGRGFSLNATDHCGQTALHAAAQSSDLSLVQVLLHFRGDVNAREFTAGWSALHFAVSKSHYSIVLQLLHSETNVNMCDNFGSTALFEALAQADTRSVSLLVNGKADLNFVTDAEIYGTSHDVVGAISTSRKDEPTKMWNYVLLASNNYDFSNELFATEERRQLARAVLSVQNTIFWTTAQDSLSFVRLGIL